MLTPIHSLTALAAVALLLGPVALPAAADPFVPQRDSQVLERLSSSSASDPVLRKLSSELRQDPENLARAVALARHYLEIGRSEGDPRFHGYAQAALAPWWNQDVPPPDVLYVRAVLRQNRHDFEGALEDLSHLLRRRPRDSEAWLTRAVVLQVMGEPNASMRSCLQVRRSDPLLSTACFSNAASLSGTAASAYALLHRDVEANPSAAPPVRQWALTVLAEIAQRRGDENAAESHFEQALSLKVRDTYLLAAYADFLLDVDRPAAVVDLLEDEVRSEALLLRLALAERRLGSNKWRQHTQTLSSRYAAGRWRGGSLHLGNEARLALHLLDRPEDALQLARDNWTHQREPVDARIVLEAALATGSPEGADGVLEWLERTGLEDVRMAELVRRIRELPLNPVLRKAP
ncbi:MAG: hypothetical protein MPN21_24170 [Thermoanaerobaculia bacterium]|nr:hypothetical protein [Thermoanaerobaculia bacterium]